MTTARDDSEDEQGAAPTAHLTPSDPRTSPTSAALENADAPGHVLRFEGFVLDTGAAELTRSGLVIPLRPMSFSFLQLLVESAGRVVSHDEIERTIWGKDLILGPGATHRLALEARQALGEPGRGLILTVPRSGYKLVCEVELLERKPSSTGEQAAPENAQCSTPPKTSSRARHHRLAAVVTAVALATIATLAIFKMRGSVHQQGSAFVYWAAIYGFNSLTSDEVQEWIGPTLSELIATELVTDRRIRVIPAHEVKQQLRGLELPAEEPMTTEALADIGWSLNVDLIVYGSFFKLDSESDERWVDARVVDVASGEEVAAAGRATSSDELLNVIGSLGHDLRETLALPVVTTADAETARNAFPANPRAARDYVLGTAHLRLADARSAIGPLTRASRAKPSFPLTHSYLAMALRASGQDRKALAEARQARRLATEKAADLDREQLMLIEAVARELELDLDGASDSYKALWAFFPEQAEHGLALIRVLNLAGRCNEALTAIEALHGYKISRPSRSRLLLEEAIAAECRGAHHEQALLSSAAARRFFESGLSCVGLTASSIHARAHVANARWDEALALTDAVLASDRCRDHHRLRVDALVTKSQVLRHGGQLMAAESNLLKALEIVKDSQPESMVASVTAALGLTKAAQGHADAAVSLLDRAVDHARKAGSYRGLCSSLCSRAEIRTRALELSAAEADAREALELGSLLGDGQCRARAQAIQADVLRTTGELGEARRIANHARTELHETSSQITRARVLGALANILLDAGEINEAVLTLNDQRILAESLEIPALSISARASLARALRERDDPEGAMRIANLALAQAQQLKARHLELELLLIIAQLEIDAGKVKLALKQTTDLIDELRKSGHRDLLLECLERQAEALLASGDIARASSVVAEARRVSSFGGALPHLISTDHLAAQLVTFSNATESTARKLQGIREEAEAAGLKVAALEIRLTQLEIEPQAPHVAVHTGLAGLRNDALKLGLIRLANRLSNQLERKAPARESTSFEHDGDKQP